MNANPYARWEYREDRFELRRWLKAPRRGYSVDHDNRQVLITICRGGLFRCYGIPQGVLRLLEGSRLGWRSYMAQVLLLMRRSRPVDLLGPQEQEQRA